MEVISRWNLLDQRTVDAPSTNAFKSRIFNSGTAGWASSWISQLSLTGEATQGNSQGKSQGFVENMT